ncbi:hypothetical protein [Edaphobacter bradus]|uniref:hypothetical protein n=1 Tax=Edaphobacter bradus TaxID=2259016 RepID=UPI0021E02E2F|nr:hypothetical protein [Edaphobacter bradus]
MQVLHGLLPYRDFSSSYAPLHAYLDAALARLWPSPLVIILFSVVCECVMFPLWLELGRRVVSDQQLRSSALLYLSSAISLQFVAIDGQDNVVIAMLFLLSTLLFLRGRPLPSGGCVGLGASVIKFLPLLYAPLFFFSVPRRWRWAAGLALPVVLIYGAFVAKHLPILSVLRVEGGFKSANNLPYLVEAMLVITLPSLLLGGIVAAFLLLIFILVARATTRAQGRLYLRPLVFGMAALTLVLVLFPKKSWPPYFLLGFFPVCLLIPMITDQADRLCSIWIDRHRWPQLLGQCALPVLVDGVSSCAA